VLGAGTAIPAERHSPAGLYVSTGREHLLFDAGPGSAQRLHAIGASIFELDRIFLTHYHLDHCLDLASILFALRIPQPRRTKPLTVYGPTGLKQLYRRLNQAFHGGLTPRGYTLAIKELGETRLRLGGATIITRRMQHSAPALGYRLDVRGKSLAYSGDTDYCRAVVDLGRGADVLILECSAPDERKVVGHLTPTACGRIADEAECRHLVLTHFYPVFAGYDIRARVRAQFRGRLTLSRDCTSLTV